MSHASFRHAPRIGKVLESGDMFMLKAIKKDAKSSQLATNASQMEVDLFVWRPSSRWLSALTSVKPKLVEEDCTSTRLAR